MASAVLPGAEAVAAWAQRGFHKWEGILSAAEAADLAAVYDGFLTGKFDTSAHRYDLGAGAGARVQADSENITQIMWPSDILPSLRDHPMRARALH